MAARPTGQQAGRLAGWLAGLLAGWQASWLAGWPAGWLPCWLHGKEAVQKQGDRSCFQAVGDYISKGKLGLSLDKPTIMRHAILQF